MDPESGNGILNKRTLASSTHSVKDLCSCTGLNARAKCSFVCGNCFLCPSVIFWNKLFSSSIFIFYVHQNQLSNLLLYSPHAGVTCFYLEMQYNLFKQFRDFNFRRKLMDVKIVHSIQTAFFWTSVQEVLHRDLNHYLLLVGLSIAA